MHLILQLSVWTSLWNSFRCQWCHNADTVSKLLSCSTNPFHHRLICHRSGL